MLVRCGVERGASTLGIAPRRKPDAVSASFSGSVIEAAVDDDDAPPSGVGGDPAMRSVTTEPSVVARWSCRTPRGWCSSNGDASVLLIVVCKRLSRLSRLCSPRSRIWSGITRGRKVMRLTESFEGGIECHPRSGRGIALRLMMASRFGES